MVCLTLIATLGDGPVVAGGDPSPGATRFGAIVERTGKTPIPTRYGLHPRDSYRPNDRDRPTIVLIHGINSTAASFVHLAPALEDEGFGVVTYDYPFDRDLNETATAFAEAWKGFRRSREEVRPWLILTHSMGALVARSYVEGESYDDDVTSLLLIGPTNGGAAVAKGQPLLQVVRGIRSAGFTGEKQGAIFADGLGEASDDLVPGSRFLRELNARPRRTGVAYHILAGRSGFLSSADRRAVEARIALAGRAGGVLGSLARIASANASAMLDELTEGTGDGCVSVASTRLAGVDDHEIIAANHVELIRGPLLYPEPGPIACMPFLKARLKGKH